MLAWYHNEKGEFLMNGDHMVKEIFYEMGLIEAVKKNLPVGDQMEYARVYVNEKSEGAFKTLDICVK